LAQRADASRADEGRSLHAQGKRRVHARDVLLELNGQAVVFARSVTPACAVRGPWRALLGLGARPLAELLYNQGGIRRTALHTQRLTPHSTWHRYIQRQLRLHACAQGNGIQNFTQARVIWARHSVFYKQGQPLRVMEAFAPGLAGLARIS
jgi:chorismate--pyruvate lyase